MFELILKLLGRKWFSAKDGRRCHVWLDGDEVTDICTLAIVPPKPYTEGYGMLNLVLVNFEGEAVIKDDDFVTCWHIGKVRWQPFQQSQNS